MENGEKNDKLAIKIIGAGGIGTSIIDPLCRFLSFSEECNSNNIVVTIIDGDSYEGRNRERQKFHRLGKKADVTAERLREEFPEIIFKSFPEYITDTSVEYILDEDDVIFLCVDNHATRKIVSDYCETLDDITLISGGNSYTDGNIQIFVKEDGQRLSLPLANRFHPEIVYPRDRSPADIGCAEESESEPQLIFMNLMIGALMLNAFYGLMTLEKGIDYDEVYADIKTNKVRPVNRF